MMYKCCGEVSQRFQHQWNIMEMRICKYTKRVSIGVPTTSHCWKSHRITASTSYAIVMSHFPLDHHILFLDSSETHRSIKGLYYVPNIIRFLPFVLSPLPKSQHPLPGQLYTIVNTYIYSAPNVGSSRSSTAESGRNEGGMGGMSKMQIYYLPCLSPHLKLQWGLERVYWMHIYWIKKTRKESGQCGRWETQIRAENTNGLYSVIWSATQLMS